MTTTKHKHKHLPRIVTIWLPIWLIFYLLFIIFGIFTPKDDFLTIIKLSGIILCFIYILYRSPKDYLLLAAMFTTAIADLILAANNSSEAGIIMFLVTQIIHFVRLTNKHFRTFIAVYVITATSIIIIDLIFKILPSVPLTSLFYVTVLILNIIASWHWHKTKPRNPQAWCALIGFTLFLCCDICSGISFLSLNHVFPAFLYIPANFFAWFFYYPSQILVSNSSKYATIRAKEG